MTHGEGFGRMTRSSGRGARSPARMCLVARSAGLQVDRMQDHFPAGRPGISTAPLLAPSGLRSLLLVPTQRQRGDGLIRDLLRWLVTRFLLLPMEPSPKCLRSRVRQRKESTGKKEDDSYSIKQRKQTTRTQLTRSGRDLVSLLNLSKGS